MNSDNLELAFLRGFVDDLCEVLGESVSEDIFNDFCQDWVDQGNELPAGYFHSGAQDELDAADAAANEYDEDIEE